MESANREEAARHLAAKRLQCTARIGNSVAEQLRANDVCDPRNFPPHPGILAVHSHSDHHVALLEPRDEPLDVVRVILPISVHRRDDWRRRLAKAEEQGGRLSLVFREMTDPAACEKAGNLIQPGSGSVAACVVQENEFRVRKIERDEPDELRTDAAHVVFFVEERDDNCNWWLTNPWRPRPCPAIRVRGDRSGVNQPRFVAELRSRDCAMPCPLLSQ